MSIWSDIKSNFQTLMETHVTASCSASFHEVTDVVDLKYSPTSNWDGAYLIKWGGINGINAEINTTLRYDYTVILQLGFEISQNDTNVRLDKSIRDVEEVIRKRMTVSTFAQVFDTCDLLGASQFNFSIPGNDDIGNFAICNTEWRVQGTTTI